MGLQGRREVLLDADVQLLAVRAAAEPDAAAGLQLVRLLDLLEAQQPTVEAPRLGLAAGRRRDLDVVDAGDRAQAARRV